MKLFDKIKKFVLVQDEKDEEDDIEEEVAPDKREEQRSALGAADDDFPPYAPGMKPLGEIKDDDFVEMKSAVGKRDLLSLKETYVKSKKKSDLIEVLKSLASSRVLVPVKKTDKVRADTMTDAKGRRMLPVFSARDQINYDYVKKFEMLEMPFTESVRLAHMMDGVESIVLDAFTDSMVISFDLADGVVKMAGK